MNYPTYYPGYQGGYYAPNVPDQLTQLRQTQMPQITQPQQPVPQSSPIWVQGEEGAKAYMVAAGCSVLLMDSESNVFYLKSSDQSGMPLPLRIFDYTERAAGPQPKTAQQIDTSQFITRDELEDILTERLKKSVRTSKAKEDSDNG